MAETKGMDINICKPLALGFWSTLFALVGGVDFGFSQINQWKDLINYRL